MAERKQGAMALSCVPLSIDFALLGEDAEQEIRARYFLTGIEDRDDVLEALTGGLSVKSHHWDTVQRDESGQWVNTPGMGDDAPEEFPGLNRRDMLAETPEQTAARQKELWALVPFDYVRSPGEERDNISVGWRYRGAIPNETYFDQDLNRYLDLRDFGFTEFQIMDEIASWTLPPGVRGNVNISIDSGGMNILATINEPGTGRQLAEMGVWVAERADYAGERWVDLGIGTVNPDHQGKEIGTQVLTSFLGFMARNGIVEAHLDADITIGRYAWAKQGFDYSGFGRENTVKERRLRLIDWYEQMVIDGVVSEEAKGEPYRAIEGIETAYDMATFDLPSGQTFTGANIDNYDVKSDHVMHAGKAFMLDRDFRGHGEWNGKMDIGWMASMKSLPLPFSDENIESKPDTGKAYFLGLAGRDIPEDASDLFFWSDFLESDEGLPIKAIRGERDISHVLRDEHGRWRNTPNAGDDAPEELRRKVVADLEDLAAAEELHSIERNAYRPARPSWLPDTPEQVDAADLTITDLKYKMREIMAPAGDRYMKYKRKQRQFETIYINSLADENQATATLAANEARDAWNQQKRIEAEWAKQIHAQFDLKSKDPIGDLEYGFFNLDFNRQNKIRAGLEFVGDFFDASVFDNEVPLDFSSTPYTSYFDKTTIFLGSSAGEATVVHEIGHWLDSDPAQMEKSLAFLERRVENSPTITLNDAKGDTTIVDYGNTITQPDNFSDPYIGVVYKNNEGNRFGSEVLSMGIEMLHSRPWELVGDPDYFEFVMDSIQPSRTFLTVSKSATKAERDISHVWRDEMGRWRNTPQAGDDAPKKPKKEKGAEVSSPTGEADSKPTPEKPKSVSALRSQAEKVMRKGSAELDVAQQEFNQVSSKWIELIGAGDRKGARALKKEMAKKAEAINQVKMGWVDQIHEGIGLEAENPAGPIKGFQRDLSGQTERMLKPALDKLGNAIDKDVWDSMSGRFPKFKRTGDQASFFDTGTGLISLTDSSGEATVWHEMGHWLEANNSDVMKRSQEFLKSRNAGKDPVDYNALAQSKGRTGHKVFADRQAYDGGFSDPYTGLIVNDKDGNMVATEVMSTGLEMLRTKPWRLMEDPEHFNFVMSVLQPNRTYTKSASES